MLRRMDSPHRPLPAGYEFSKVLGSGEFGEVVLARHAELKRLAAIKLIPAEALLGDDGVERFVQESKRLLRTESRAVLRVYDVCPSGDDLLVVMEYARGRTLADVLTAGPMPADKALVVLADVADALHTASAREVVHGGLKPSDVFVTPNGHAKVGGFGLNRLAEVAPVDPTRVAPEIAQGGAAGDHSDAYAFAVLAREVLAGRRAQDTQLAPGLGRKDALKPSPIPPGFPAAAASALKAGMTRDPAKRISPTELVRRLATVDPEAWPPAAVAAAVPTAKTSAKSTTAPKAKPAKPTKPAKPPKPPKSKGSRVKTSGPPDKKQKRQRPPRPPAPTGRRARKRSWRRIVAFGVVSLAVLAAGAFGMRWFMDQQGSLKVDKVGISVRPATATIGCPGGTFSFRGSIDTRGGKGSVTYQWTRPNGTSEPARTVAVGKGRHTTPTTLSFTASGAAVFKGVATLHVLKPVTKSAAQKFTYACSGK